jgi:hypothetical protein
LARSVRALARLATPASLSSRRRRRWLASHRNCSEAGQAALTRARSPVDDRIRENEQPTRQSTPSHSTHEQPTRPSKPCLCHSPTHPSRLACAQAHPSCKSQCCPLTSGTSPHRVPPLSLGSPARHLATPASISSHRGRSRRRCWFAPHRRNCSADSWPLW